MWTTVQSPSPESSSTWHPCTGDKERVTTSGGVPTMALLPSTARSATAGAAIPATIAATSPADAMARRTHGERHVIEATIPAEIVCTRPRTRPRTIAVGPGRRMATPTVSTGGDATATGSSVANRVASAVGTLFPWRAVVAPWLVSRLLCAAIIVGARSWPFDAGLRFRGFQIWDGVWYTAIARDGYGALPVGNLQTRWPFFPLVPGIMRGLARSGPGRPGLDDPGQPAGAARRVRRRLPHRAAPRIAPRRLARGLGARGVPGVVRLHDDLPVGDLPRGDGVGVHLRRGPPGPRRRGHRGRRHARAPERHPPRDRDRDRAPFVAADRTRVRSRGPRRGRVVRMAVGPDR